MYPAAQASAWGLIVVTSLFSLATVGTMLVTVKLLVGGFTFIRFATFERYSHAIAGCLVLACGLAVKFGL
jgi:hypothetical protein